MSPKEYTIEQVNPMIDKETNQQRTDKYGNLRYYVKFQGEADSIPLSAKTPPQVGGTKFGSIEQGEFGKYFKSAQNPNKSFGGSRYDSDGQKQGMAIKSAADYVTKHSKDKLAPEQFAKAVEAYATALYNLQLKKQSPAPKSWEDMRAKSAEVKERVAQEEKKMTYSDIDAEIHDLEPVDITNEELMAEIPF